MLTWHKVPLQAHRMKAHVQPQPTGLADLRLDQEVTAVDEGEAAHLAAGLTWSADRDR